MKTYEVIKKLMEDSTMKFMDESGRVIGFHSGLISFFDKDLNFIEMAYFGYVEHNWQLVKQPVTWQEAIQAWNDGEVVKVITTHLDYVFSPIEKMELWPVMIQNGTWYVED